MDVNRYENILIYLHTFTNDEILCLPSKCCSAEIKRTKIQSFSRDKEKFSLSLM